jgi:adenosylcobyric acid synthase
MSNFTDFEPLVADEEIELSFISNISELSSCQLIVIPGSKRVVEDLAWLRERGFESSLVSKKQKVVAICGGYEMMFERILDPLGIESGEKEVKGFGRIKGDVIFEAEKTVKKGSYKIFGHKIQGYEIHNAQAKNLATKKKNLYGTFLHGLFDNDGIRYEIFSQIDKNYQGYNFKEYKKQSIKNFASHIEKHVEIDFIVQNLHLGK